MQQIYDTIYLVFRIVYALYFWLIYIIVDGSQFVLLEVLQCYGIGYIMVYRMELEDFDVLKK